MKMKRRHVEINPEQLDQIIDSTRERPLREEEHAALKTAFHALVKRLSPRPRTTEKLAEVLGVSTTSDEEESKAPKPGHGRNGSASFSGAKRIQVPHQELQPGVVCPDCCKGKVYSLKKPQTLLRFVGQMPINATVYELQQLRCNLCGQVYAANEPEGVGPDKYDETVPSIIACLKYGKGIPFTRLEVLQETLGVPMPASTQWELVEETAEVLKPAHEELVRQAAQGEVLHNDDTSVRILEVARPDTDKRTGLFTSGIVSKLDEERKVALFFTGTQHAGENMRDLLAGRESGAAAPVIMSDALACNVPKVSSEVELLLANCLAHGRRHFTDIVDNFPDECRHVLKLLGKVYKNEKDAREGGLSPKGRLAFHQEHSGPLMKELKLWMNAQLEEKKTEPNSGLGKAMKYLLTHWDRLTLFLRHPGAPLDNNICERALKKAVLHRKNALFYKTLNGAQVGDLFMSLIHTCELNKVNPFDYVTELQRHAAEMSANPSAWMPWNYMTALARPPT